MLRIHLLVTLVTVAPGALLTLAYAQDPPPAAPQVSAPAAPVPPAAPVLENKGKPITVPYQCTNEDIRWAGLACSEDDPCPVYLELAAVEAAGNRIIAAGNIHSDTVTLYSVLLSSEDIGRTWTEPSERIRGAGLDRLQFASPETGWAGGEIVSPLPQDPFLLITTDGGKSWRQKPIFSEAHFGSIQQLYFDSKSNGGLIIDQGPSGERERYARYESEDGGESWSIREANRRPLVLKHGPAPVSAWRVRTDGVTHAFHLEHREGTRWNSVASFAVKLTPCKPEAEAGK